MPTNWELGDAQGKKCNHQLLDNDDVAERHILNPLEFQSEALCLLK